MMKHVRTLKANRRARILPSLVNLYKAGVATAQEIGSDSVDIRTIEADGLVRRVDTRSTGKRGRPAVEYSLTGKGRKRVQRAIA